MPVNANAPMNIIKLKTPTNAQGEPIGPTRGFVATTAEGDGENNLGGAIRIACEIELLRGEVRPRRGGGQVYRFECDEEKAQQLAQLITLLFFTPNANLN